MPTQPLYLIKESLEEASNRKRTFQLQMFPLLSRLLVLQKLRDTEDENYLGQEVGAGRQTSMMIGLMQENKENPEDFLQWASW